eukprot:jgi/Mesen1/6625/ME000034S06079
MVLCKMRAASQDAASRRITTIAGQFPAQSPQSQHTSKSGSQCRPGLSHETLGADFSRLPTSSTSSLSLPLASHKSLELQSCASFNPKPSAGSSEGSTSSDVALRTPYASIGSRPSRYARIHGPVSSAPVEWEEVAGEPAYIDIIYEKAVGEGIVKISINRPERRNAFRPETVVELIRAFNIARDDPAVGVILFAGKGEEAFCSGGDQAVRGKGGYVGRADTTPRLNVLDLQVQIRRLPKPVIAVVAGYAVGGGHVLHMICDLTIAADNAVGSFDAGYGSSMMARLVGQKKAREMWFLARFYSAQEALAMGLVNTVVPLAELESEAVKWSREILRNSPTALRVLKAALNATEDGHAGLQELAGNATLLFYGSEEGTEGRQAFMDGRLPDFSKFPRLP